MKKLITLLLATLMVMSLMTSAFADNNQQYVIKHFEDGTSYILNTDNGEKMTGGMRPNESGELESIPLEELVNQLNNSRSIDTTQNQQVNDENELSAEFSMMGMPQTYSYALKNARMTNASDARGVKVTPDVHGGTEGSTITHGVSETISESFSASVGLTGTIKTAIEAGASFSWTDSASTERTFSASHQVPAGEIGYVRFHAYYDVVNGTLYKYTYSYGGSIIGTDNLGSASGFSPKKVGSFADGIYLLILR